MTQQGSEITEIERAAQNEAGKILTKILAVAFSPEGPEGAADDYDGPFPNCGR